MKKKPTQLAGMKRAGIARDGSSVLFELEAQNGKVFNFSCPHEAISEIVLNFTIMADLAWKQRGSPDETKSPPQTRATAKARSVTGLLVSVAREGVVLSLLTGPLKVEVLIPPEMSAQSAELLSEGHKEWLKNYPPN